MRAVLGTMLWVAALGGASFNVWARWDRWFPPPKPAEWGTCWGGEPGICHFTPPRPEWTSLPKCAMRAEGQNLKGWRIFRAKGWRLNHWQLAVGQDVHYGLVVTGLECPGKPSRWLGGLDLGEPVDADVSALADWPEKGTYPYVEDVTVCPSANPNLCPPR